jgi:UDP-N-acetylmuramoylalanine-D-glutamate ligase
LHPYQLRYDSKATNAIATITAIKALINQYENIVLIAGGIKKQEDYNALFAKSSNISKLAQAGDSKIAPLSIKVLATLTAASIELA